MSPRKSWFVQKIDFTLNKRTIYRRPLAESAKEMVFGKASQRFDKGQSRGSWWVYSVVTFARDSIFDSFNHSITKNDSG
jgi:hypothetical protein